MKQLICGTLLILLLGTVSSCGNDLNPEEAGNNRSHKVKEKPVMKTIRLQFGGDYVSETEEPLLRAEDGETYTAINVFRKEKDNENALEEEYAYGLFKGLDPISIDVTTGYLYRFVATILKDREDEIRTLSGGYTDPFRLHDANSAGFDNAWSIASKDIDFFHYTYNIENEKNRPYFCQLTSGTAYVNSGGDLLDGNGNSISSDRWIRYPRVKRFYGNVNDFDPALMTKIEIPMVYKCFGLKFILERIPEGTWVTVKDITSYGGPTPTDEPHLVFPKNMKLGMSLDETKTWEGIYSLNKLTEDSRNFRLQFSWEKGNGEKPDTFTHEFTVTAKKMKVLKLNIDGDVNETKSGNIIFTNL